MACRGCVGKKEFQSSGNMMFKRIWINVLFISAFSAFAQDQPAIQVSELGEKLYLLKIRSVNAVASIGPDGVLISDTGYESSAGLLLATLNDLGGTDIKYVINTHWHHDHTGGNEVLGKGAVIAAHSRVKDFLSSDQKILGDVRKALPETARPALTFEEELTFHFNGDTVDVIHMPPGHTAGNSVVWFHRANVVHLGDLLFSGYFPFVDLTHGGDVLQYAGNLRLIMDRVPEDALFVAGHGPAYTRNELERYRRMILDTYDAVRRAANRGMDAEAMKSGRNLKHWEKWGVWFISEDTWIETICDDLKRERDGG